MKKTITIAIASLLFTLPNAQADETYSHFPSLASEDTSEALCNLAKFNEKLQTIVKKETLTPEDMVKVHELTYTLENAVIRLQKDLDTIAIDLERAHLASEHLKWEKVKQSGEKYLSATSLLLAQRNCNS